MTQRVAAGPHFRKYLDVISRKNPMHHNNLIKHFALQDELFWQRTEVFAEHFSRYLAAQGRTEEDAVDAYLQMCHIMLKEQLRFQRTGTYSCANFEEAHKNVYSEKEKMIDYMLGLALSQYLWNNHYRMLDFFINGNQEIEGVKTYLEVGVGHALYFIESLRAFAGARFQGIDISEGSLATAAGMIEAFAPDTDYQLKQADIFRYEEGPYDYIVMGEVLEHVDDPLALLGIIAGKLPAGGHFFVTTCANAPAEDHVYLYDSVGHIRQHLEQSGFTIRSEIAFAVDGKPEAEWEKGKTEVNYAAFLRKKDS